MSNTTNSIAQPKSRTARRFAAVLAAGALFLAACADDDTEDTGTETETTEAMEDSETTEAMEDDSMEEDSMEEDSMEEDSMEEGAMGDTMGAYGPGCAAVPTEGEGSFAGMADDPAATAASNNPALSTLVTAVTQAGLVDTLNSDGPFTIFAPTNDAFAAVPEDVLNAVLADQDLLTSVLTYHVIPGESLKAEDLASAGTLATVEGGEVELGDSGEMVDAASVVCSNVPVANGTVHIIDSVLLPQVAQDAIAAMSEGGDAEGDEEED